MKLNIIIMVLEEDVVAPLAGAWIEIVVFPSMEVCVKVAPLAGAWIEIKSRPRYAICEKVAPLAGAWIEINLQRKKAYATIRRSPRGSVD